MRSIFFCGAFTGGGEINADTVVGTPVPICRESDRHQRATSSEYS